MTIVEYLCMFVRASGDRLQAAERLVLALPQLVDRALVDCELRYQASQRILGVYVHLRADGLPQAKRDRLVFWTARAGGRAMVVEQMSPEDRARIDAYLASPSHEVAGLAAGDLLELGGQFFTRIGAAPDRRRAPAEAPQLVMDVGGPGWDGVRWNRGEAQLFVAAPYAPPLGDEVPLLLRIPGDARPVEPIHARATVAEVRAASAAGPGAPAGYVLRLEDPPAALVEALDASALGYENDSRTAPRFHGKGLVKVGPAEALPPAPRATIEYATDQELAADYIQNLSQGGAFVRSSSPPPVGATVQLQLKLPNGAQLDTVAMVAFTNANGMGVRFQLSPEAEAVLSSAMAHISARARRALVVDDDEMVCRMMADALRDRGFEVLTAGSASEGLSTLAEELLALDLLLTDLVMPGMSGEELVRLIRKTGGEADLAIVGVTGNLAEGVEAKLEAAGADAVLDKALGPDLIAQAADAVLERKRMVAQQG